MEIKIQRKDLLKSLQICQGVATSKGAMSILSYMLLQTVPGGIELTATDLEISVCSFSEAQVVKDGQVTLLARKAFEIVRELPEMEIHITQEENNTLQIKCGKSKFTIHTLPATDFPSCPQASDGELKTIDSETIADVINRTVFAIPIGEARYAMNGALFEAEKNVLNVVATDGHRLSCATKPITQEDGITDVKAIVSRKFLLEASKVINQTTQSIKVSFQPKNVTLKTDDITLTGRLIEGNFPNYKQVIPETNNKIKFVKDCLASAIRRVSILSDERNRGIKINVKLGQALLSSNASECGNANETIAVDYMGEEITLGFNADYVLDVLKVVEDENVVVGFNDALGPCLILPETNQEYKCVIMPLRVD